jgi:hypothetical protein
MNVDLQRWIGPLSKVISLEIGKKILEKPRNLMLGIVWGPF